MSTRTCDLEVFKRDEKLRCPGRYLIWQIPSNYRSIDKYTYKPLLNERKKKSLLKYSIVPGKIQGFTYLSSILFLSIVFFKVADIGFILLTLKEKEVEKMRRISVFIILLVCFIFIGAQVAFSQEQKEQKGEYQKRIESKLKEVKQKLEELKSKAAELKEDAKKEFNEDMKQLHKKEEAANKKLKELKSASTKTWEKTKAEMDKAIGELDKQYDKMMSRFKKT